MGSGGVSSANLRSISFVTCTPCSRAEHEALFPFFFRENPPLSRSTTAKLPPRSSAEPSTFAPTSLEPPSSGVDRSISGSRINISGVDITTVKALRKRLPEEACIGLLRRGRGHSLPSLFFRMLLYWGSKREFVCPDLRVFRVGHGDSHRDACSRR